MRQADWKGKLQRKFRWSSFKFEWGRYCYTTDWAGEQTGMWWEWERDKGENLRAPFDVTEFLLIALILLVLLLVFAVKTTQTGLP